MRLLSAVILAVVIAVAAVALLPRGQPAADAVTPTPTFPPGYFVITNDSGAVANKLVVNVFSVALYPVVSVPPGCGAPTVVLDSLIPISRYVIVWPEECVDPGESTVLHLFLDCTGCGTASAGTYTWSSTFKTFLNDTGKPANGLHVTLATPSYKQPIVTAPAACTASPSPTPPATPTPLPTATPAAPPFTEIDLSWPSFCVAPGESVKMDLWQFPYLPFGGTYGVGCTTCGEPPVSSYSWSTPLPVGGFVDLVSGEDDAAPRAARGGGGAPMLLIALAAGLVTGGIAAPLAWRYARRRLGAPSR